MKTTSIRSFALPGLICLLTWHSPASASDLVGSWVKAGTACTRDTTINDSLLFINKDQIVGYEFQCDIVRQSTTKNRTTIRTVCAGEGETYRKTFNIDRLASSQIRVDSGPALIKCSTSGNPSAPGTSSDTSLTRGCLKSDTKMSLSGRLSLEVFPGPPNFESIKDGDREDPTYILTLRLPVCLDDGGEFADPKKLFDQVHVSAIDPTMFPRLKQAIGKEVAITGEAFAAHTAHHHAPLVMFASDLMLK
ncbi:DUF4431 domain-containing protein [Aquabacter sp. CN5-332]|uniref:DUF4431 domain-containing protein n=1 Tax=Aquabacter sp. CN5-332 TaxID=3156608 RepID=UPI0032B379F2